MGKQFNSINEKHREMIAKQKIFFVATAPKSGKINLSPKGSDSFRVLGDNRVTWLNLTGSGNETAAHLLEDDRMTIMFCSFDQEPQILRLYGRAKAIHPRDPEWNELLSHFPEFPGPRQVIDMQVEMVQTSCGFAVPVYEFVKEREKLHDWAKARGPEGVKKYWQSDNSTSLDGKPTGI